MAISPPSQIVLDMLRAPSRSRASRPRAPNSQSGRQSGAATAGVFSLARTGDAKGCRRGRQASQRRRASSASRRWCCRPSSRTCCPRTAPPSTARAWPATCGNRCSPKRSRTSWPSAAASALPTACSATTMRDGETKPSPRRHRPAGCAADDSRKPIARFSICSGGRRGHAALALQIACRRTSGVASNRNPVHHLARIDQMSQYDSSHPGPEPRLASRSRRSPRPGQSRRSHRAHRGGGRRGNRGDPHRHPFRHQGVERPQEPLPLRTDPRAERRRRARSSRRASRRAHPPARQARRSTRPRSARISTPSTRSRR